MRVELRFFASVRETIGVANETVDLPDSVKKMGDVRAYLVARGGVWSEGLNETQHVRMALNHEMVNAHAEITSGAEIAFFPPVTGG